jgi:hypothetical protein
MDWLVIESEVSDPNTFSFAPPKEQVSNAFLQQAGTTIRAFFGVE